MMGSLNTSSALQSVMSINTNAALSPHFPVQQEMMGSLNTSSAVAAFDKMEEKVRRGGLAVWSVDGVSSGGSVDSVKGVGHACMT